MIQSRATVVREWSPCTSASLRAEQRSAVVSLRAEQRGTFVSFRAEQRTGGCVPVTDRVDAEVLSSPETRVRPRRMTAARRTTLLGLTTQGRL
jgi:hypothetical protein